MDNNSNDSVPCIHVLYWKKVENNFVDGIVDCDKMLSNLRENVDDIRESLIQHIASYFGNDKLVAQYVLLNMISKVVTRKHGILIGNLSLNLTGFSTLNADTVK